MNVIDSLVVVLGLDTTQFKRGQKQTTEDLRKSKEEANSTAKAIEASGKQAAAFFSKLRNEALLLFAAFTGASGLKQFTEQVINSDASMARLSRQLDMNQEDLSAWTSAVHRTGGSAESAAGSFQSLEDHLQNLATTGNDSLVGMFRYMGIAMMQDATHARPLLDIMKDLNKWAQGKDPAFAAHQLRALGLDDGTINFILKKTKDFNAALTESRQLGVPGQKAGTWAEKLQEDWRKLEQAATDFGRQIVDAFAPAVDRVLNFMAEWIKANKSFIDQRIDLAVKYITDSATELWNYISHLDWDSITKTAVMWAGNIKESIVSLYNYIVTNWPEIKNQFDIFITTLEEVWKKVDTIVQAFGGWGKVGADFFVLWAFAKFTPIIGAFAAILSLVTAISGGMLGLSGRLALFALRLAPIVAMLAATGFAGGEDQKFSDEKNSEFLKNRGAASPLIRWLRRLLPEWAGGLGLTSLTQDESMSGAQQAFLDTLAGPESGGDYTIKEGGSHFDDFSRFPEGVGPGGTSTAAGRYQFTSGTWHDVADKKGLGDFSPESQDKAAWYLAATRYHEKTGGDLEMDVKAGKYAEIAAALKEIWPSLPGGSQSRQSMDQFIGRFIKNMNTLGEKTQPRSAGDPSKIPTPPRNPVSDLSMGARAAPTAQTTTSNTTNTSTSEVSIGQISVHTQATDVMGISRSLIGALRNSLTIQQVDGGLN